MSQTTVLPSGFNITAFVGAPSCGKTTLLKILRAAAVFVNGFVFCDMSEDIIQWHLNPANKSPLHQKFVDAEDGRSKGNLLDCNDINQALAIYLEWYIRENNLEKIRHLVVSGWPRKKGQTDRLYSLDPHAKLIRIDIKFETSDQNRLARIASGKGRKDDHPDIFGGRWERYREITRPAIDAVPHKVLDFDLFLPEKLRQVIRTMNIKDEERASLLRRIYEEGSAADKEIVAIIGKREYKPRQVTKVPTFTRPAGQPCRIENVALA